MGRFKLFANHQCEVVIFLTKDIYKITNKINGKVYIGQSKNPYRRFKDHLYGKNNGSNSAIHNAIKRYGIDAFTFEILEHDVENYNDRERYWIQYYNSTDREYGYNITPGGEDPPVIRGEDNYFCKLTDDDIREIRIMLRDTDMMYEEICKKFNISDIYLQHLNNGKSRPTEEFSYPIRDHGNRRKQKYLVITVVDRLMYSTKSEEEIARELGIDSNTIYDINAGIHYHSPCTIDYPIRNPFCRVSRKQLQNIYDDLAACKEKMSELESKYDLSHATMSRINRGVIYHNDSIDYPIRKSSQRVYSTCRDYPGLDRE